MVTEVKTETPQEAYDRVYAEVQKAHSYRFTWDENSKCVGKCACGAYSPPLAGRDEVSEKMGQHAEQEATVAASTTRRRLEEILAHKADQLIKDAVVTDSRKSE